MYDPDQLILTPTAIDSQDIKQEAVLRELETGTRSDCRIIFNELQSQDRILYYGSYHRELDTAHVPWSREGCPDFVVNELVDWALKQPSKIQTVVFNFLESEDKESELENTLKELGIMITVTEVPKHKKIHLSDIIRDNLPATKEELIALIQELSPETKRPAATVRQWARRDTRKGRIYLDDQGYYRSND